MSSGFDSARFERERAALGLELGGSLHWRDETESTNDDALSAAKAGAAHGSVFGAEAQTRGRGRRGSEWVSAPGAGLWFSVLLRPELNAELASGLSLCAGLAVRAAVAKHVPVPVLVKWPNDVLVSKRKVCGILIESQVTGPNINSVIVGIGINVAQTAFPEPLANIATSLALLHASELSREALLADALQGLERELERLTKHGLAGLAAALREHDALLGRRLRVEARQGVGAGIDDAGRLLLQSAGGERHAINAGHVELLD
jgi:BirA family transcriptional regulator, biotin operon repressor / biotin---[acetyl-CoA-carboxylase] ligase